MKRLDVRLPIAARWGAIPALLMASASLFAQPHSYPPAQNVVQLAAHGTVEVQQDWLSIAMSATRDGGDAAQVQAQLKSALDAALSEARKMAQPGRLEVRTGNFSLYPRYGRDGKPLGWQGVAELILEGRDFSLVSGTAGKLQTLTVASLGFGLSREQRLQVEGEAQGLAIERFKARAMDIARGFGFAGYSLREVNVSANDQGVMPRPRVVALEARASMAESAVPVEAGKTSVVVTVSGSVQLK